MCLCCFRGTSKANNNNNNIMHSFLLLATVVVATLSSTVDDWMSDRITSILFFPSRFFPPINSLIIIYPLFDNSVEEVTKGDVLVVNKGLSFYNTTNNHCGSRFLFAQNYCSDFRFGLDLLSGLPNAATTVSLDCSTDGTLDTSDFFQEYFWPSIVRLTNIAASNSTQQRLLKEDNRTVLAFQIDAIFDSNITYNGVVYGAPLTVPTINAVGFRGQPSYFNTSLVSSSEESIALCQIWQDLDMASNPCNGVSGSTSAFYFMECNASAVKELVSYMRLYSMNIDSRCLLGPMATVILAALSDHAGDLNPLCTSSYTSRWILWVALAIIGVLLLIVVIAVIVLIDWKRVFEALLNKTGKGPRSYHKTEISL